MVVSVAFPLLLRIAVPRVIEPSMKVTEPVGVPVPDAGLTVAVNVTAWPKTDELSEEVRLVVVAVAALTVSVAAVVVALRPAALLKTAWY